MEALRIFAEHYPWESTLLLILNKACLDYLRPRMCWKQAYGVDQFHVAVLECSAADQVPIYAQEK